MEDRSHEWENAPGIEWRRREEIDVRKELVDIQYVHQYSLWGDFIYLRLRFLSTRDHIGRVTCLVGVRK